MVMKKIPLLLLSFLLSLAAPAHAQLGTLSETLASDGALWQECALGDAAADAARQACGTQLAMIGGGELGYSLIYGGVSASDLENAFPSDAPLYTVSVTPAQLAGLLEALLSRSDAKGGAALDTGSSAFEGFPQISGFSLTYDVTAVSGSRLEKLTLEDGTALDLADGQTRLTLAATESMLSGVYGPVIDGFQPTGHTLRSAFAGYLSHMDSLSAPSCERITVKGLGGEPLISKVPFALILIAAVVIGALGYSKKHREDKFFTFDPYA